MDTKEKIRAIVLAYDLQTLGVEVALDDAAKALKISLTVLEKYAPSFLERTTTISIRVCYDAYRKENPGADFKKFFDTVMTNPKNFEMYRKTLASIESKLQPTIDLESLKEFHRVKCLNLTQVSPNQIDMDKKS